MATDTEIAPSQQAIDAQRQLLEQQWEAQQMQAFQEAGRLSTQEADVLRAARDKEKTGNVIGATALAGVSAVGAHKLLNEAGKFRNPEALAEKAGTFVVNQASKGNGTFGWGKFDPTKAAEAAAKKFGKDSELTKQVTSQLNTMVDAAKNAEGNLDVGLLAKNAKDAAKEMKTGNNFNVAAGQDIAGKGGKWLTNSAQNVQGFVGGLPKGIKIGGTVAVAAGAAYLGAKAYDGMHQGSKQRAAMLNEQIAAKEAEATKWQNYVQQRRETAAQDVGQPQMG